MKPILPPPDLPDNIEAGFGIDWDNLITSATDLDLEDGIEYLMEIKKYSNNDLYPYGIFARKFGYKEDPGFGRLLSIFDDYFCPGLQASFIPVLFTKTTIKNHLQEFHTSEEELKRQLAEAKFQYSDCFNIEGQLSSYLYYYGMYEHFYDHNSAARANLIARDFTRILYRSDPGNVICFTTALSWGKWFDTHSCTDHSFVFVNKEDRSVWLLCFSHSD